MSLASKASVVWAVLCRRARYCSACGARVWVTVRTRVDGKPVSGPTSTYGPCGHHLPVGRRALALALLAEREAAQSADRRQAAS